MMERSKVNEQQLDTALSSEGQEFIRQCVKSLPEEAVSLEWRSQLNERLLASRSKPRIGWSLGFRWALAGAAALAAVMWVATPKAEYVAETSKAVPVSNLIAAHAATVTFAEIAGPGLSDAESLRVTNAEPDEYSWSEADLDAL